jgi:DNA-binding MarR family transcriptional regulator
MSSNASRAWYGIFELLHTQKSWVAERFSAFDLTPQLGHALHVLARKRASTMKEFAEAMFCDASNATGLIDRLEARGYVAREPATHDRRAKVVRLTPAGLRLHKRVDERLAAEAPPPITALSAADQRALREIIDRALANVDEVEDRAG